VVGNRQGQNRIAQKLQPLVRRRPRVADNPGAVGERLFQQAGLSEPISESLRKSFEAGFGTQELRLNRP